MPGHSSREYLRLLVDTHPTRRFLALPTAIASALYVLFVVTFANFRVDNDALVYYNFLRRFLGENVDASYSRGFGSALFSAPFYLVARAVDWVAGPSSVFGAPLTEAAIVAATTAAFLLTLYLGWRILLELELPAGPAVLLLAVFGTPLFYYTAFQPTYKHGVDTLAFTLLAFLLLRAADRPTPRVVLPLAATLAFLVTVRPANVVIVPAALAVFLLERRPRRALLALVATIVAGLVLFALPAMRDIPARQQPSQGASPTPALISRGLAAAAPRPTASRPPTTELKQAGLLGLYFGLCDDPGYKLNLWQCLHNAFGLWWDGAAPAKMLFTVKRGLFLWTPLTALSLLGAALLFWSRPRHRAFLAGLWLAGVLLLLVHLVWADFWTGGFSFSQRFLTSLFPLYLVGTAELVRRWRRPALAVLTLCAVFSLYAGFSHYVGYRGISERDGLGTVLGSYTTGTHDPIDLARKVGHRALERYGLR